MLKIQEYAQINGLRVVVVAVISSNILFIIRTSERVLNDRDPPNGNATHKPAKSRTNQCNPPTSEQQRNPRKTMDVEAMLPVIVVATTCA